jgi:4-amino-4-deoxy-L-arabinose transferase-like glycosyltransferase
MYYTEPEFEPRPPLDKREVALTLILVIAWLLPGLFGHEPWKPDEAYNFGLVYHMMQSGDWLFLHLPGEHPFASPPLFYMTAALFGKLFAPFVSLPDALRLATGFYMGLSLLFTGLASRILYGRGSYAVLIMAGSLGLLGHAHQLVADSALFAGCSLAILGFCLYGEKAFLGGALAGLGMCMGFLSKGFIAFAYFVPLLVLLPFFKPWRSLRYLAFLGSACVFLLPSAIWPYLLHQSHPELYSSWLKSSTSLSLGLRHDAHASPFFYLGVLPWFAWPTLPLAAASIWREKGRLFEEDILFPLIMFLTMLAVLMVSATQREIYAMPMLLPLSLLAASGIDSLRRGATSAFNWFGILTFGLLASVLWIGWVAMMTGHPEYIAGRIHHYHPHYSAHFGLFSFLPALGATLLWAMLATGNKRNGKRAVINWASGVAMVWMLLMTIWLPFLDSVKGYREMFHSMKASIPPHYGCIEGRHVGDAQRAMLDYYLGIDLARNKTCKLVLIQSIASNRQHPDGLKLLWQGARAGDRHERYRLYVRN